MMELATNTIIADSRMGSQSAARETIRVLLQFVGRMQEVEVRLYSAQSEVK
jgi:hypothetical protein